MGMTRWTSTAILAGVITALCAGLAPEGIAWAQMQVDPRSYQFSTLDDAERFADTGNENIIRVLGWAQKALLSICALMIALWGWGFLSQSAPTWTRAKHLIIIIVCVAVPGLIVSAIMVILQ